MKQQFSPKSTLKLSEKHIHIVSLDVPYPLNYGGAIDIFYRIVALHQLGYKITLHCFEYGRGHNEEMLEKYTDKLYYYPRKKPLVDWLSQTPFIVNTRGHAELLENLLEDDFPILFEGLHTTYFLRDERLKNRVKIVRTHNIEHEYYKALGQQTSGTKKIFFQSEAWKLEKYEPILEHADHILAIQENDVKHFKQLNNSVHLLPASLPTLQKTNYTSTDQYCLFHGNLSVPENEHAALWIIEALASTRIPLIIAGKEPSDHLNKVCEENGISLRANLSSDEMSELIQGARLHVLFTKQSTGLKLKLLQSLNSSGHVLVNDKMVEGTTLHAQCVVKSTKEAYASKAFELMKTKLSEEAFNERQLFLNQQFDTRKNCKIFEELINA